MKEKDPLFVALGKRGGAATAKKYGKKHYEEMSKKGRDTLRKKILGDNQKAL